MDIFKSMLLSVFLLAVFGLVSACHDLQPIPSNLIQASKTNVCLKTLENKPYDLTSTIQTHEVTALVWWATQCPCVQRFHDRIHALRSRYAEKQVAIIAIASNADDDMDTLSKAAEKRKFQLPIVIDQQGALASLLSIQTTPTVVLIKKDGSILFKGWIDNERTETQAGRIAYLQDAIDEALAQKPITHKMSPTFGCTITRSIR